MKAKEHLARLIADYSWDYHYYEVNDFGETEDSLYETFRRDLDTNRDDLFEQIKEDVLTADDEEMKIDGVCILAFLTALNVTEKNIEERRNHD